MSQKKDDVILKVQKNIEKKGSAQLVRPLPLPEYETLHYKVKYLGVYVGSLTASIRGIEKINGRDAYKLEMIAKTRPFFSKFFKVDDRFVSYMDVERLHVLRHEEYRREGKYKKDALIDFDQVNHRAYYTHLINQDSLEFDIPENVQDGLTSVYYFRTLDFNVGDSIEFDLNIDEVNYHFLGTIPKKKKINFYGEGRKDAFVIQPYIFLDGKKVKKGRMTGYFSADARRIPPRSIIRTPIFGKATVTFVKEE